MSKKNTESDWKQSDKDELHKIIKEKFGKSK